MPNERQMPSTKYHIRATVSNNNEKRKYIGLSVPPFKVRYANHKTLLKHERYRNSTELSKLICELKDKAQAGIPTRPENH